MTSAGYHVLRQAGVAGAPAGAVYTQIGADGNLRVPAIAATTVYSGTSTKALLLWNGSSNNAPPTSWADPSFADAGWVNAVVPADVYPVPISGATGIWCEHLDTTPGQEGLFRHAFSLPAGRITSAVLTMLADSYILGFFVNGTYVGAQAFYDWIANSGHEVPFVYTIPPTLLLPNATNVLAVWAKNSTVTADFAGQLNWSLAVS